MRRFKGLLGLFAFALLVLSLPTIASAQWGGNNRRDRDRDDDYYGRNNGYQLRDDIRRLRNDSRDFVNFLDNALDRSRMDDSRREDRLNEMAREFRRATERLESRFNTRDIYRSQNEAQQVINMANRLDNALRGSRLGSDIRGYWNNMQRQVDNIARAYRYNNRGNRNGGWRDIFNF